MLSLKAIIELAGLYLSLSKPGKEFFTKAVGISRQTERSLGISAELDIQKILYFVRNFQVCDKVFNSQVTDKLCSDLGRDKTKMYARFVSYGWFSLLIWGKMLEAFNLAYDQGAKERCVLVAFTHREWNDLFDNQGYSFDELFKAFDYQAPVPRQLNFLRQLKQMEKKLAPPERFGTFYRHLEGFRVCSLFEYTPEKAQVILDQVAPYVGMLFMYVMVPDIPEGLKETMKPVARWLYMLDELVDLEHDRRINRVTYMIMSENPEKTMLDQFCTCREVILENAPNPDKLVKLMETITSRVIDARNRKADIENSFFNLG